MKKILFVIPTMRMGGAEKSLVTLLNCMDRQKYKIDLLLFETGGVLQTEIPDDVNIIAADKITKAMILEFRYYAKNLLREHRYGAFFHRLWASIAPQRGEVEKFSWKYIKNDIPAMEGEYDIAISYLEGLTAFYLIDRVKADKKIGWIHIDMSGRKMTEEEKQYYEKFDHLITISEICRKVFLSYVPSMAGHISILENMTDVEVVRKKAVISVDFSGWIKNVVHIVTVGRLDLQKGIDLAVLACKILRDSGIHLCWHVYGEGVQRHNIEKMIEENSLKDTFFLEGMQPNPYPYMKKADIIVQPSRYEGKSIVLDEAKVLGKAIVVTNYSSVTDQITDRETGLIVECTPEGIAGGVECLVKDKRMRENLEMKNSEVTDQNKEILYEFYKILET